MRIILFLFNINIDCDTMVQKYENYLDRDLYKYGLYICGLDSLIIVNYLEKKAEELMQDKYTIMNLISINCYMFFLATYKFLELSIVAR